MSKAGITIMQKLFQRKIRTAAKEVLKEISNVEGRSRVQIENALKRLSKTNGPQVHFGETEWDFPVSIPQSVLTNHSLVVGATGAGKSYVALLLLVHALEQFGSGKYRAVGILDAKGELAAKAVDYLQAYSKRMGEDERELLKAKTYFIDFSRNDLVTPYNILYAGKMPSELLVNNRIETISQIYHGSSSLTPRMKSILRHALMLLVQHNLPITMFDRLFVEHDFLAALISKTKDDRLRYYFTHRFPLEPNATKLAIRQRVESLFLTSGVRLSLSAASAPDFQRLQDEGCFVIINVAGPNISRGTSEFLLRVILHDIQQSVFRRQLTEQKYLWCLDEAQVLFKHITSRENMNDLLTLARAFGSYFLLLTQSLSSAVRDRDIINSILTNIRWILLFRSTLRDAQIIEHAIPVTGTVLSSKRHPYDQQRFLTKDQELKLQLEEMTRFPDRVAHLWLKSDLPEAIRIRTRQLAQPEQIAGCDRSDLDAFKKAFPIGNMVPREKIQKELEELELWTFGKAKHATKRENIMVDSDKQQTDKDYIRILESSYSKKASKKGKS